MQKNGAGLHTASSCFWDNTTDGLLDFYYKNIRFSPVNKLFKFNLFFYILKNHFCSITN